MDPVRPTDGEVPFSTMPDFPKRKLNLYVPPASTEAAPVALTSAVPKMRVARVGIYDHDGDIPREAEEFGLDYEEDEEECDVYVTVRGEESAILAWLRTVAPDGDLDELEWWWDGCEACESDDLDDCYVHPWGCVKLCSKCGEGQCPEDKHGPDTIEHCVVCFPDEEDEA